MAISSENVGVSERPAVVWPRATGQQGLFCWLLDVPATCECTSGTDMLGQFLRAATLR